jgi:lipopolysaccharide transport system permease protein
MAVTRTILATEGVAPCRILRPMVADLAELYGARDLLRNFVARDLQVRYKGSVLGVVWSLLNPLATMAIYTLVFSTILKVRAEGTSSYPVFFLAGFLPWMFFSTTLQIGSFSLLSHSSLLQKVYFPREVLPISLALANLINMGIALCILIPFAAYEVGLNVMALISLLPVIFFLLLFASGLTMVLSALMVYFRDVEFLLGIVLNAWFFATPIVYQFASVPSNLQPWFRLNPVLPFVNAFRDVFIGQSVPPAARLAECLLIGVVTFTICYLAFGRLERRVAEEL